MARPLDRERASHGEHSGFGASGRNDKPGAAVRGSVGGGDVKDITGLLGGDPATAERECAMERTLKDDPNHGVECVRGELFGAGEEVAGGVVHEGIDAAEWGAEFLFRCGDGGLDGGEVAHVGTSIGGAGAFGSNVGNGLLQRVFTAANEEQGGAEIGKAEGHRAAEAGSPTGDEDRTTF